MISKIVKTLLPITAFSCVQGNATTPKKQQKPNIIYIMCDDMGYGDLGCYGQKYILTPNIDRMAKEGMRFTQAYAGAPVSAPSRACLMTGQHSGHTEVRGNKEYWQNSKPIYYGENKDFSVVGQHPYDPNHIILPEIMKDNGYRTGSGQEVTKALFQHLISEGWMISMAIYANSKPIFIIQTSSTNTTKNEEIRR